MTNHLRQIFLSTACFILPGLTAQAASISISFLPSPLISAAGQTITFSGTITNLEAVNVDLNGCDITLPGQFTTDCGGPFLTNSPLFLAPNETSLVFDMFTVTSNVPYTGQFGVLPPGTFTVTGGVEINGVYDGSTQDVLGQKTFAVTVVPEPSSAVLIGLALPLVFALRRRLMGRLHIAH